ncbi:hypothetical protein MKZ38_002742 [Zalerion maritima]|uniref:Uncharacterized protein n=1 Tax=Zalerion maritima TaxID=339359 RepID=A0AAD5RV96_9PEZI|nr:hypothetical protein MKZ38_002742 [Zalerion maritima]
MLRYRDFGETHARDADIQHQHQQRNQQRNLSQHDDGWRRHRVSRFLATIVPKKAQCAAGIAGQGRDTFEGLIYCSAPQQVRTFLDPLLRIIEYNGRSLSPDDVRQMCGMTTNSPDDSVLAKLYFEPFSRFNGLALQLSRSPDHNQ